MASSNSTNPLSENVDPSIPLLTTSSSSSSPENDHSLRSGGRNTIREAARILRRASSRRMMREPSVLVREAAAEQLEERQSDWAYSRPVVVLDVVWNLAFVVVATVVLVLSRRELPGVPLRLWIVGYALQCTFHILCVCIEYRRRRRWGRPFVAEQGDGRRGSGVGVGEVSVPSPQGSQYVSLVQTEEEGTSCAKYFESANTMFSFIWWIIGFYWVSSGGQTLALDSPQLYWLCIIFLAFDVFFVVFCVALACVIGIAVCCFLPCIIAILYAVADQEGASREDIEQLPKYKFEKTCHVDKQNSETRRCKGGIMIECGTATPTEHVLALDDSECCICLSAYDDGVELRELPCSHHFHCTCVDKWLHINATCPLCKYNILKSSDNQSGEEVQV